MVKPQADEAPRPLPEIHDPGLIGVQSHPERTKGGLGQITSLLGSFPGRAENDEVSGGREPPPPALAEPDVNLSAHPAPIAQPSGRTSFQWANRVDARLATSANHAFALRVWPCNRLYFLMAQRTKPSLMCRSTGYNQDL
jgi:hypothetical protein